MSAGSTPHPRDDLAVYAVDGLDDEERAAVERHLATCPECRRDLAGYHETLASLTVPETPPRRVWDNVVAEVRSGPPAAAPVAVLDARRRRGVRRGVAALGAAAASLAIGFVAGRQGVDRSDSRDVAALADAALADADSAVGTLLSPDGVQLGRLVIGDGGTFVVLDEPPPLAPGQSLQLWHLDAAAPVSLGVIDGGARVAATTLPAGVDHLALTVEPAGGVPTPTGPIVARGTVPALD